jgi:hypothetical protein
MSTYIHVGMYICICVDTGDLCMCIGRRALICRCVHV